MKSIYFVFVGDRVMVGVFLSYVDAIACQSRTEKENPGMHVQVAVVHIDEIFQDGEARY